VEGERFKRKRKEKREKRVSLPCACEIREERREEKRKEKVSYIPGRYWSHCAKESE